MLHIYVSHRISVFTEGTNLVATGVIGGFYAYSAEPYITGDNDILGKFKIVPEKELYILTDVRS